jgi:hypothetical protein
LSRLICPTISERSSAAFRASLAALLMVAVLAGTAVAGPYEDALAAIRRSDCDGTRSLGDRKQAALGFST